MIHLTKTPVCLPGFYVCAPGTALSAFSPVVVCVTGLAIINNAGSHNVDSIEILKPYKII